MFRVAGIQVYLHWTWLAVAWFEIGTRVNKYQSMVWNVVEYLTLFGIVLLHEFGHALACRQVGGQADRIMLWPLGGVAFVQPPPRPGALLWSIAAGPLVNVVLVPITVVAVLLAQSAGLPTRSRTSAHFLLSIAVINAGTAHFQHVADLPSGRRADSPGPALVRRGAGGSLMIAGTIGLIAAAGLLVVAIGHLQDVWLAAVSVLSPGRPWRGFRMGLGLHRLQPTLDLINQASSAMHSGRHDEAVEQFTKVINAGGEPGVMAAALRIAASPRAGLEIGKGRSRTMTKRSTFSPNSPAHNNLAWLLATCPVDGLRNGHEAVEHATWACQATEWSRPHFLGTLAAACAEIGDFDQAVRLQQRDNVGSEVLPNLRRGDSPRPLATLRTAPAVPPAARGRLKPAVTTAPALSPARARRHFNRCCKSGDRFS